MDIRVTSTGKIFYRIDPAVAALLLEALPGSFEAVNNDSPKPASRPVAPSWGIGLDQSGYPFIQYTTAGYTSRYAGPPDKAVNGFKARVWSGEKQTHVFEGPEPPPYVVEEYRQRYDSGSAKSFLPIECYQK